MRRPDPQLGAAGGPDSGTPQAGARPETDRDTARAFTREERDAVVAFADADPKARSRDLGDPLAFLAGTGVRIGEACALRWSMLDLAEGYARLGPTVIRETGEGLRIQGDGKSKSSTRTVKLPPGWSPDYWPVRRRHRQMSGTSSSRFPCAPCATRATPPTT